MFRLFEWRLIVCLTAFVHICTFDTNALLGQEPKISASVAIEDGVGDWVVQEATGRVFASMVSGSTVVEYDAGGKEIKTFVVGQTPTEMLIKGDRLIVACRKSPALHVIDLNSNKVLGEIPVSGKGPYALFCSKVDNGLVYCTCNTGSAWWDGEIFQCDIAAMKLRKQVTVQKWGQRSAVHVAMSPDGKWIAPDARGVQFPSGINLMKVDEDEFTFRQIRSYHESVGQMVAGPLNRYWTFGNTLYSLDITKKTRTFAGSPVAIHPNLDLAVSRTKSGIALERFSDASPISTVSIGNSTEKKEKSSSRSRNRDRTFVAMDPTIQYDLSNNLVFVGDQKQGHWIDFKNLATKVAPLMMITAPSEVSSLVGKEMRIPVKLTSQGSGKLSISKGSETAKLENGAYVWLPQAKDVGLNEVQFQIEDESKVLDQLDMTVHVTLPKLELGFEAKSMELSPDGRYLLAWGVAKGQEDRHPAHKGADQVVVFDAQEQKMLVKKTLPSGIRCATIDDQYVYIAPNSGNLFYRFNKKLGESSRMFLNSEPKELIKISPDLLAVVGDGHQGANQTFNVQTLKAVSTNDALGVNGSRTPIKFLGHNEVQIGNRVVDPRTGEPIWIEGIVQLPTLVGAAQPNYSHYNSHGSDNSPLRWGRRFQNGSLTNYKGNRIATLAGAKQGFLSKNMPAVVGFTTTEDRSTATTTMQLADLRDGTSLLTSVIDVSTKTSSRGINYYGTRKKMIETDKQIFLMLRNEVLLIDLPTSIAKGLTVPPYFSRSMPLEIEVAGNVQLKLPVAGKMDGVSFSLQKENPKIELDSETGELTIDTESLWETFINKQSGSNRNGIDPRFHPSSRQSQSPDLLNAVANAKSYKLLTGKDLPAGKLATQLPISASLVEPEGLEDGLQFSVIVLGPRKSLDDAIAKRKEDQAEQMRARQKAEVERQAVRAAEAEKRRAEMAKAAALKKAEISQQSTTTKGGSAEQRLEAMEARMRRMEAMLDSVLKRLDER